MNCQDIALVLDEGDVDRLPDAQRREAEAHLASCPVCRMEQQIQHCLASVAVPALPPGLAAQCLKRVDAVPFKADVRRNSRRILVGVSLAIAAAAAFVVVQVASPPPLTVATAKVADSEVPTAVADGQSTPVVSNSAATEIEESLAPPEKPKSEPVAAVTAVPVRLVPLDSKGLDATSVQILDQFHVTLARGIAAIPGASMLSANEPAPAGLYIEISMKLAGVRADGARSISVPTMLMRGGQLQTALLMDTLVAPGADLTQPVDKALNGLRSLLRLPGDPSVRNELNARMRDPAADRAAKQIAMSKLLALSLQTADTAERKALYATALDLLAGGDPVAANAIWIRLQNGISPELMDAASDALPAIKDMDVRRKLLTILSNTMRNLDNPRMSASMRAQSPEMMAQMDAVAPKVRAQLESIAESDPNRLNRMVATRALSGDAEWNEFVVASLKNTTLTDAERLEGFAYLGAGMPVVAVNNPLIDDAAMRSAEELIVRMGRDPQQERQALNAVNVLAAVKGEVARDAAITVLRPGNGLSAASPVRAAMLVPLMMNKGADPAVRQAVEELASNDPDPLMRRRAGQVLQVADQLAKDRMPAVLLQSSLLIESATPAR
jgi:hypothetical protein